MSDDVVDVIDKRDAANSTAPWQRLDDVASGHAARWPRACWLNGHVNNANADRLSTVAIDTLGGLNG